MKRERGCGRNYGMNGGGTATYSMGGMVAPGNYAAVTVDGGACSIARPGLVQVEPRGLMGGSRRRNRNKSRRMRGGRYGFDLTGQGMAPNQFAAVVPMRGESCSSQAGGAADLIVEAPRVGYSYGGELVTTDKGSVFPVGGASSYNTTNNESSACKMTGGRRSKKTRKMRKSRKTKKPTRKHKTTRRR